MKLGVYSVYDAGVQAFLPPFFARAKGEALRGFVQACNDEGHQFRKHAADYSLFELGEFDDVSGAFASLVTPARIIGAVETWVEAPIEAAPRARPGVNGS